MTMPRRDQPLYRDIDDKMVGGVCSGLGRYFDVDTTLVRVAFAALTFAGGSGPLAYLILWAVLETAPSEEEGNEPLIVLSDEKAPAESEPEGVSSADEEAKGAT